MRAQNQASVWRSATGGSAVPAIRRDLRSVRTSLHLSLQHRRAGAKPPRRLRGHRKHRISDHSVAGAIARLIELSATPEVGSTKGFAGISNSKLLRVPSQSRTPLERIFGPNEITPGSLLLLVPQSKIASPGWHSGRWSDSERLQSFISPRSSALAPSVSSKATFTFLPSNVIVQIWVSPCPRIRRSSAKVRSFTQRPLAALIP